MQERPAGEPGGRFRDLAPSTQHAAPSTQHAARTDALQQRDLVAAAELADGGLQPLVVDGDEQDDGERVEEGHGGRGDLTGQAEHGRWGYGGQGRDWGGMLGEGHGGRGGGDPRGGRGAVS